jgi:hypothetical protein
MTKNTEILMSKIHWRYAQKVRILTVSAFFSYRLLFSMPLGLADDVLCSTVAFVSTVWVANFTVYFLL